MAKDVEYIDIHYEDGTQMSLSTDYLLFAIDRGTGDERLHVQFSPQEFSQVAGFFLALVTRMGDVITDVLEKLELEE